MLPPTRLLRPALLLLVGSLLVTLLAPAVSGQEPVDDRPPMAGQAASLLPPGNSGFVSTEGQASGTAGGSYGDNTDDQTEQYWGLEGYAGQGFADPAAAVRSETLRDGAVRIYWDSFGVPAIYGDTGRDVWYGAGYAIAQIRLFLMDAVRRLGRGTYAELVGSPGVSDDVMTRTLTYSEEEYQGFLDGMSAEAVDAFEGYVEGANAWIAEVNADPELLPAEYVLLNTTPEPLDVIDVLAAGVLITRTVASEGGQEMDNVRLLRQLETELGEAEGRGVFTDLVWQQDDLALTTVPREEGTFPNTPFAGAARDAQLADAFADAADYAATLPLELADGQGTGAYPDPQSAGFAGPPDDVAAVAAAPVEALTDFAGSLHGGSIAVAMGPAKTADEAALLLSGPQLGYSYPSLLVELEVHGGGYDARGASVPALPTVGIGYTDRVAWALTTGYSKTIDSFIETVRGAGPDLEYFHDEQWKPAECRTESIPYREAVGGALPAGPPVRSEDVEVCRTVHGPIVSMEDGEGERLARSVQYQMFGEEAQTVEGVLAWNRARDLEDFEAAMRLVTWNENTTYADADGHIAFWHPGIHRERPAVDLRLPVPGDGSADFGERLPFEALPQAIDPEQGYLANWNNKPAHEWLDGIGIGPTSRPGGPIQRVVNPIELITSRDDHTFETLQALEVEAGLLDPRAGAFVPLMVSALRGAGDPELVAVADLLEGWNRRHYDPPGAPATFNGPGGESSVEDGTDGPGATVFEAVLDALLAEVFDGVWGGPESDDLVTRQLGVGSHRYDASPAHNLLLRILAPSSSALTPSRDYLDGRSADEVIVTAAQAALEALATEYESMSLEDYRRPTHTSEVSSLTGVIGPSSSQPYMDRGSYIHVVGFDPLAALPPERVAGPERVATSVAASQRGFPDGAASAVLAPAGSYLETLIATPLAGAERAPLLLVDGRLSDGVLAELARLGVERVLLVGLPREVLEQLAEAGHNGTGLPPEEPLALARHVAEGLVDARGRADHLLTGDGVGDAYVVTSENFPDAVAIAAVAARTGSPIIPAVPGRTDEVVALLQDLGVTRPVIVGGVAAVGEDAEQAIAAIDGVESVRRLAGPERYATSAAVMRHAEQIGVPFGIAALATGENYPDSLSGGALAGAIDAMLVLVRGDGPELPGAALDYLAAKRASLEELLILGGTAAITEGVAAGPVAGL